MSGGTGENARRIAGRVLLAAGACLLLVACLGRWTGLGRYPNLPPRGGERFSASLAGRATTLEALAGEAESRVQAPFGTHPADRKMRILHEVVSDRFTHGPDAEFNFFGNWLFRVAGRYRKGNLHIEDPDTLLRLGHSAFCDAVSFVLYRLAERYGIPARHAFLDGHVVMEAFYDGGWHAFDPDMEIVVEETPGTVASVAWMAANPDRVRSAYAEKWGDAYGRRAAAIFSGRVEYMTYPEAGGLLVKGQRPGRAERIAGWAQYAIPAAMIAVGALLAFRRRERPEGSAGPLPKEDVRRHFEEIADAYDGWKRKSSYYYALLADVYREFVPEGATVLEIGCGTGTLLASLRPRRGVGVDISDRMVAIAREKHPGLEFLVADAERLSLGETFERVIVPDVIEHLSDVPSMFRSARRCCAPGGRVVVTCINPLWAPVLDLAEKLGMKMPEGEHRWLPAAELLRMAAGAGLGTVSTRGRILFPKRVPLLSALLNRLARIPLLAPVDLLLVLEFAPMPEGGN